MKVKYTDENNCVYTKGLTLNKEYEATLCEIHNSMSYVHLINDEGKEASYTSVLFDEEFQNEFHKAIYDFNKNQRPVGYRYGIFEKDYLW